MTASAPKNDFIRFLMAADALLFGEFTLKSGRKSPYFFNAARFRTGSQIAGLGRFFAGTILEAAPQATIVFGPAYKGIPLSVSAAIALGEGGNREMGYLFNRKEEKTHGDRGLFVGQEPGAGDRLVLVDDVITDGETKREAVELLRKAFSAPIDALVIAFDRMEQGEGGRNALKDFQDSTGIPVRAILTLDELMADMEAHPEPYPSDALGNIRAYREKYGLREG